MRYILTIIFVIVTRTVSQNCKYEDSVELTNRTYNSITYDDGEYFFHNETGVERGCVCMKQICARKCCPLGQAFNKSDNLCVYNSEKFDPPVMEGLEVKPGFDVTKEFYLFLFLMDCETDKREQLIYLSEATNDFHLETDGRLHFTKKGNKPPYFVYAPDKYCIDNFIDKNSTVKLDAMICTVLSQDEDYHYSHTLNASCMLVSCFFIILTVAVYVFLPELRNTVHGIVMISYLLSFFVGFLFMATMQLLLIDGFVKQSVCVCMSLVIYFSILAGFFWLNVMCFDLWWKLRTVNVSTHGLTSTQRTRLLRYSAYAFGMPTALSLLLVTLEFSDLLDGNVLKPKLTQQGCFLIGMSKLIYFYSPIIIGCMVNVVFFILVALRITEIKKQTQRLQKKDTQRFALYIKLFLVTGINWILEAISDLYPDIDYVWQFTDAYNVLVGLLIFIIFICKKKIFMALKHRYKHLMGLAQSRSQSNTTASGTLSSQSREDIEMKSTANTLEKTK